MTCHEHAWRHLDHLALTTLTAACRHDLPQCRLKAGEHVAVKVVKKPQSRSAVERLHMIRAEVEILRSVQHANSEPPR